VAERKLVVTLVSVVILTFNRWENILGLLDELSCLGDPDVEIIVVDNGSADGTGGAVAAAHPEVRLVALGENMGVGGRNRGMGVARGDIILTLDDDMTGMDDAALVHLREAFADDPELGALNLKVTWPGTDRVRDWVHHRPVSHADRAFRTYEVTEGAVAWRRQALDDVGLYREDFFISHEGLDLALRLIDAGWAVGYDGSIAVGHMHAVGGRKSWRRYYYDTRNLFWIAVLHLPWRDAVWYLAKGLGAMLVYSLRDGFGKYWWRAVRDGLAASRWLRRERKPVSGRTRAYVRECDRHREGFWSLVRKRLRQREFSLE
jgi:GT2 family glycosyltransferase